MGWQPHVFNMKVDEFIQACVSKLGYRLDIYFEKRINARNLSYILTDIYLVALILGDEGGLVTRLCKQD